MGIGQSLLNIRRVVITGGKTAKNFIKKHPVASTAALGFTGLVIGKALTTTKKEASDNANRMVLMNPVINPLGFFNHMLHPNDTNANELDNPIIKYFVDRNNRKYQADSNASTQSEQVREFYNNGGKGLNFDKKNHLENVVYADDGGKIYVYSDDNGSVIGSVNVDKNGRVRNISRDNPNTNETDLSVSLNPKTGKVQSVYVA